VSEEEEVWRAIPGLENYQVSSFGRIYSMPRITLLGRPFKGRLLGQYVNNKGYKTVSIQGKTYAVHRLVALAFLGPPPEEMVVDHGDTDKTNNHFSNLEYVTAKENVDRAVKAGRYAANGCPAGERHPNACLTDAQVRDLLHLGMEGMKPKDIATHFGISRSHVYTLLSGKKRKV